MVDTKTVQQNNNSLVNTGQFAGIGFVGVKQVEYFSKNEESIVFSDIQELLENRNYSSNLMLCFFATQAFGTEKVEKVDSILAMNPETNEMAVKQLLKKAALFDFSEAEESVAGELHLVIAADCIVHWDSEGSYIQPTQENSLILDIEDIVRSYPANYKIIIYTHKDVSGFKAREFVQKTMFEIPVKSNMWYNQPTFQQAYGNTVLTAGLITLALAYGALNWQKGKIQDLRQESTTLRSQQVDERFYSNSTTDLHSLNGNIAYKTLMSLITKDISNSLSKSGFELGELEFTKNFKDQSVLVTITSKKDKHTQFSVQEPLAQRVLDNSSTIKAIKKKTVEDSKFVLQAIVDLREVRAGLSSLTKGETN